MVLRSGKQGNCLFGAISLPKLLCVHLCPKTSQVSAMSWVERQFSQRGWKTLRAALLQEAFHQGVQITTSKTSQKCYRGFRDGI